MERMRKIALGFKGRSASVAGRRMMRAEDEGWLDAWAGFVSFVVRACGSAPGALVGHADEVVRQFEQVTVRSLPIVLGAGLSVGLVTWLQTHRLLVEHGAESTLPSFLAAAV